jgi:GTP cyclohydrolase I
VRILIRWIGEDPAREGLRETPKRVLRAYEEWFAGYENEPKQLLERCFEEVAGYDETVLLRDVPFRSHCEHHIAPITGRVHLAYLPDKRVVGISKLVRLVQVFSNRLQIQERLTAQIADTINEVLKPRGTGVVIQATHACMTGRGVHACGTNLVTSRLLGVFRDNVQARQELFAATDLRQTGHALGC